MRLAILSAACGFLLFAAWLGLALVRSKLEPAGMAGVDVRFDVVAAAFVLAMAGLGVRTLWIAVFVQIEGTTPAYARRLGRR